MKYCLVLRGRMIWTICKFLENSTLPWKMLTFQTCSWAWKRTLSLWRDSTTASSPKQKPSQVERNQTLRRENTEQDRQVSIHADLHCSNIKLWMEKEWRRPVYLFTWSNTPSVLLQQYYDSISLVSTECSLVLHSAGSKGQQQTVNHSRLEVKMCPTWMV